VSSGRSRPRSLSPWRRRARADLWVKLEDVAPDGTAWNLSSPGTDVLRASWRDAGKPRRPLAPGEIAVLRLPNLRTGNLFAKGHRVRIVLCGSFMRDFSRNLQTGESEMTSAHGRKAAIRIHHDAAHASRILLPVVPDAEAR
jgi:predicted acyl esterase